MIEYEGNVLKKSRMLIIPPLGLKIDDGSNFTVFEQKIRKVGQPDEYIEDQGLGYYGTLEAGLLGLKKYAFKLQIDDTDTITSIDDLTAKLKIVETNIISAVSELKEIIKSNG